MEASIKKIILIDFKEKQFKVLEKILDEQELLNATLSEDIFETIQAEQPHALMINSTDLDFDNQLLHNLISKCRERNTPLFFITTSFAKSKFIEIIQNKICNIITTPISRKDFILRLERYIKCSNIPNVRGEEKHVVRLFREDDPIEVKLTSSELNILVNSLLGNLGNQIKFSKINLREKKKLRKEKTNTLFTPEEQETEKMLWEMLENDSFVLYYQPVISLDNDRLFGFEALIRANHPERGIINPGEFIDVAERSEIIHSLGLWIVETACKQSQKWKEKFELDTPLRINTNLSARQFLREGLSDDLIEITERYGTNHEDIGFELTESTFMENRERANIALLQLKAKHFSIYMDDFGTGYSSLSYLVHFPVDILKIDQSFIKWMNIDEQSETIVKSIIKMSHSLGLKVVAEGTEEKEHIEMLKNFGCDYAQGYCYSKPLSPQEAEEYIGKYFERKNKD